jgi:hypothetical protein
MFSSNWKNRKNVLWSENICFGPKNGPKTASKHMFLDQKHDFKFMNKKVKKIAKIVTQKFVTNATFLFFFVHVVRIKGIMFTEVDY